jgi:hypothetical protein
MAELSEEKLTELDIPHDVNIVLPVPSVFIDHKSSPCFPEIFRSHGNRRLDLVDFREKWNYRFAFLLQRRKKS